MKKYLLIISLSFLFSIVFYSSLRAQFHSEAPITISESGEILTDMIYVKFKPNDVIELPIGDIETDGNSISENYPLVKKIFVDYCKEWHLSLNELKLIKAIPQAREDDTLYMDNITGEIRKLPNLAKVYIVRFPKPVNVEAIISRLKTFNEVEYTHGPVQWVDCAEMPNDPKYSDGSQWYLNTIQAPGAWGITKGSNNIKIALIENGVELTHTDLQSKIVGGDGNPNGIQSPHGTWVAGIAGAVTNNNIGIASLGWNISLLTYQPYNDDINLSILAQKIIDAVDDGANVINCSFRTIKGLFTDCGDLLRLKENSELYYYHNWDYNLVHEAIDYAIANNAVVVAAAGNAATPVNFDEPCELVPYTIYPAQYPGVIAVSGSQQNNNFVVGWNYGSHVDVNAPGRTDANVGLWTTDLNNNYTNAYTSGTSFSAPLVSALAALLKSLNPSFTPSQIETILESTADEIDNYPYV